MTEKADEKKKGRSLAGFYIGLGVAAALLLGGWFAWTPLRIGYYEWRIVKTYPKDGAESVLADWIMHSTRDRNSEPTELKGYCWARSLVDIGPQSRPTLERLLRSENPIVRRMVVIALGRSKQPWAMALLVEASRDTNIDVAWRAVYFAGTITDQSFFREGTYSGDPWAPLRAARRSLLNWWEREGRAEYGDGR